MFYSVLKKINFERKLIIVDCNNNIHEFGKADPFIKVKLNFN